MVLKWSSQWPVARDWGLGIRDWETRNRKPSSQQRAIPASASPSDNRTSPDGEVRR